MKGFTALNATRFRRTFTAVYALSCLIPLLFLVYFLYQHVFPALDSSERNAMETPARLILLGMLVVPGLGAVLMRRWIGFLENLTEEVRARTAEIVNIDPSDDEPANEILALRLGFDSLYRELQDKMEQLNQYSNVLIDTNLILTQKAITDGLTGFYNRRYFQDRLPGEVERATQYGWQLSVIMLDVDGFKRFNDVMGHQVGDEVLRTVGAKIKDVIRKSDLPFRYGGDEFIVVLPQCTVKQATALAKKMIQSIREVDLGVGREEGLDRITISCGVAGYEGNVQKLVGDADQCLLKAKQAGKGRVVFKPAPIGADDKTPAAAGEEKVITGE